MYDEIAQLYHLIYDDDCDFFNAKQILVNDLSLFRPVSKLTYGEARWAMYSEVN